MKLVAIKSFSYNSRRLNPGDIFEAKDPDGRLLIGVVKARKIEDRKETKIPEPKKEVLDKFSSGGRVETKIPTSFLGEKPSEQTISKEKAEDIKNSVAGGDKTVEIELGKEAPAKEEVKEEPKEASDKEEESKSTPNRHEVRSTRGRRKN